jgi:uncharacterized protein (DUF1330 family)
MRRLVPLLVLLATTPALAATVLDDYFRLQMGTFSSAAQARQDSRYETAIWHMAEVWPGQADDARWFYVESWIEGAPKPYVQRLTRVTANADGTLTTRRYTLPDPARFVGAWQDPGRFSALQPGDLAAVPGCDQTIVRAGTDRFEGSTTGVDCANGFRGAAYMLSRLTLTATGMTNWDRGFDATGKLVWGPKAGGYRFVREGAGPACDAPVRMLVHGEINDREAFIKYITALRESGLYERTGGYYEAITPPLEVFEGEPPKTRGVVISRFPCLEAARSFWNSPEYREIVKLRAGAAKFEVIVLPAPPLPEYLPD